MRWELIELRDWYFTATWSLVPLRREAAFGNLTPAHFFTVLLVLGSRVYL